MSVPPQRRRWYTSPAKDNLHETVRKRRKHGMQLTGRGLALAPYGLVSTLIALGEDLTVLTSAGPCRREDEYDVERKSDLATTKNTSHRTTVPIPNRCLGHLANQHNRNEHESSTIHPTPIQRRNRLGLDLCYDYSTRLSALIGPMERWWQRSPRPPTL